VRNPGVIVDWFTKRAAKNDDDPPPGMAPGTSESGFAVESADLPGIGMMKFRGGTKLEIWAGEQEPGSPVALKLEELFRNDFVGRIAAIPKVPVPSPFDAAAVLDNLRAHIATDIVELKLIESTFASQLDRILQAAADAVRRNNVKAARDHLHDAFKLLHKEQSGLDKDDDDDEDDRKGKRPSASSRKSAIDRLATRVIAFDLKYIEKRLEKD
jgi:hypothetical protein